MLVGVEGEETGTEGEEMSKTVFVVDIDTTIANNDHRAELLEKECLVCLNPLPKDYRTVCEVCGSTDQRIQQSSWDKFLQPDLLLLDTPVAKAQDVLYRMRELYMEFHFITGRNEELREVTEKWLTQHFGWVRDREALKMRDSRHRDVASSVYKRDALRELIEEKSLQDCRFIFFEDDPYVFRMYQQFGIVIKCPEGWEHWMPPAETGHEPTWRR